MNKGKYVFSQLLDFLDKDVLLRISNKYNGNRYASLLPAGINWHMMFRLLLNRESLRDLVLATQAHTQGFSSGLRKGGHQDQPIESQQ